MWENGFVHPNDLARGIACFNRGEFFASHELLEDVWRAAPPEHKKFFQGLVQAAVAFHHHSTGNRVGMRSVMERAITNLSVPSGDLAGIKLAGLLESLAQWRNAMDKDLPPPPLPRIERVVTNPGRDH